MKLAVETYREMAADPMAREALALIAANQRQKALQLEITLGALQQALEGVAAFAAYVAVEVPTLRGEAADIELALRERAQ